MQAGLTTKSSPDNIGVCTVTACVTQEGSPKTQCQDADCHCLKGDCPGTTPERPLPSPAHANHTVKLLASRQVRDCKKVD